MGQEILPWMEINQKSVGNFLGKGTACKKSQKLEGKWCYWGNKKCPLTGTKYRGVW